MKFWHRLAHLLGLNSEFVDCYSEDGWIVRGDRCAICGEIRNTRRVMLMSDYEGLFTKLIADLEADQPPTNPQ